MSKRKAPKFNTVLEDFRRFIGESKTAEESQGNNETSISKGTSDSEVNQALPGSGKATGSNSDKGLSMGVEATEKAPGTKEPTQEERSRKECSPSSKIAEDGSAADLVNKLLSNIKLATEELEKQAEMPEQLKKVVEEKKEDSAEEKEESSDEKEEDKEDKEAAEKKLTEAQKKIDLNSNGKIESKDLEALRKEDKPKVAEDTVNTEEGKEEGKEEVKEASSNEIDEDALAEKIAMHYRNVSVGYELGKFLFKTLEDKMAEEAVAPQEAPEAGSAEGSEIELILQALQELVQEGQISEEQAQQVLMQLQSATEGGAAPEGAAPEQEEAPEEATEEAPEEEEPKTASLFSEKEIKEIETNINSKVAEWVSEGKTDKEITELVKQAAENDAKIINEKKSEKLAADANNRKLAALVELGYSTEQIEEYFKTAQQQDELNKAIDKMVCDKVAELKEAGKNDAEITEYLNQAAVEDAKLIKSAMEQESIQAAILNKVAEERKQKMANVSPEVQQILQALEALLQSGQISEEEAMQVLQELGLSGGGEEAAAAPAAPEAQAPVPPQAA